MIDATFTSGPLSGATRGVARAPRFLRAVGIIDGGWAVLDGVDDLPASEERLHAYVRIGEPFCGIVDWHDGRGRRSNRFATARYASLDDQPPEAAMRDTAAWQAWCRTAAAEADAGAQASPPATPFEQGKTVVEAVSELFGLPDAAGATRGRRTPPPADAGQGHLFGGRP